MKLINIDGRDHASCIRDEQDGMNALIVNEDVTYIPAGKLRLTARGETDAKLSTILLLVSTGDAGLHCTMTPDACRNLARQLLSVAGMVEANAAQAAADAIARARTGGGEGMKAADLTQPLDAIADKLKFYRFLGRHAEAEAAGHALALGLNFQLELSRLEILEAKMDAEPEDSAGRQVAA
jgi:hypothetical protein